MATANHHNDSHSSSASSASSPSPFSLAMSAPVYHSLPLLPQFTLSRHYSSLGRHSALSDNIECSSFNSVYPSSPSSVFSPSSLVSSLSSDPAIAATNPLTWYPLSPPSPSPAPPTTLQLVQRFFDERSETRLTATSDIYITATRKFHDVSDVTYRAILGKFFAGDARPQGARIDYYGDRRLVVITLPGLPHELMARFDAAMQNSLVDQGFLWPGWGSEWLGSSGATRINLTHGRRKREMEPDGGLQVLCQELPFLIVEVANSQDYEEVLEKASWALKYSKGRIRYAILIKLVNKTTKERREDAAQAEEEAHGKVSAKRSLCDLDSSPPTTVLKRVRTDESSLSSQIVEIADDRLEKAEAPLPPSSGNSDSDVSSELSSVSSADSTNSLASDHGNVYPVTSTVDTTADHDSVEHNSVIDSSPPSIYSPSEATLSGSPALSEPPSTPNLPPPPFRYNPRAAFSRAHLTVLGTTLTANRRVVTTLLDCIELWPTPPGPQNVFSFSWDDMPTPKYPNELRGKRFTIEFMSLHRTLDLFVKAGDQGWVEAHKDLVMEEWKEEVTSGTSGSAEEEEEDQDQDQEGDGGDTGDRDSGSDADYEE